MTALNFADVPASVNTVEAAAIYFPLLLERINPGAYAVSGIDDEGKSYGERATAYSMLLLEPGAVPAITVKVTLKLNGPWTGGLLKIWQQVQQLSNNAIPQEFKP